MPDTYSEEREERIRADQDVVNRLLSHGADVDKEYAIDFLFLGDAQPLEKIGMALNSMGYVIDEQGSTSGRLLVSKKIKLSAMQSPDIIDALEALAGKEGVTFDGWGAVA